MFRRIVAFTLTFVHIVLCCLPICQAESLSDTVVEKRLCNATMEDEFEEDSVIVVLTQENSNFNQVLSLSYFDSNLFVSAEDLTYFEKEIGDLQFLNEDGFNQIYLLKLKNPGKENVLKAIRKLENEDFVQYVCPNYIYSLGDTDVKEYNSNISNELASYNVLNNSYYEQYGLQKINASAAWEITTGSAGITVGVIDSGIDVTHPDLAGQCSTLLAKNFTDDGLGALVDPDGHGTHVAGIIGAIGDNDLGISGVCWDITMIPLRVFKGNGKSNAEWIIKAFRYAIEKDIPILNYSAGGYGRDPDLIDVLDNYTGLLVCSAGNDAMNTDTTSHYPSGYDFDNIVSVAGTDPNDELYVSDNNESNYGATTVDLAALGQSIKSTVPGNAYQEWTGTSMAERFTADDLNGDGKDDVAMMYDYGNNRATVYAMISQGNSFSNQVWYAWSAGAFNANSVTGRFTADDFNGDGKHDVAMMYDYGNNQATVYALISQGSSFSNQVWYSWSAGTFNANAVTGRFTAGDFNVDGKDDILSNYLYSYGTIKSFVQYSTGSGFTDIQEWSRNYD